MAVKATNCQQGMKKYKESDNEKMEKEARKTAKSDFRSRAYKTEISIGDYRKNPEKNNKALSTYGGHDHEPKHSMVQEQKYRDFLNRKKKLLSEVSGGP